MLKSIDQILNEVEPIINETVQDQTQPQSSESSEESIKANKNSNKNNTNIKIKKKSLKKQIIFIRHGQTEESTKSIVLGQMDGILNKTGIKEAQKVGEFVSNAKIDVAYISDLKRVTDTFDEIHGKMEIKIPLIHKNPLLRDINLGKFQGTSIKSDKTYKVLQEMNQDRNKKIDKKSESWNDLEQRSIQFWNQLCENELKKEEHKQIIIVSHKGFITTLLENAYLSDIEIDESIKFFNMPLNNGELIVMKTDYVNGKLRMIDFQRKLA